MKKKILLLTAALATLLLPYSCEKQPKTPKEDPVEFTVEISDIAIQTASVSVSATGSPTLVRMVDAIRLSDVQAALGSLEDEEAADYFIGVVAFNKDMDVVAFKTATFKTLEPGSIVIGGGSGAGSVNENTL